MWGHNRLPGLGVFKKDSAELPRILVPGRLRQEDPEFEASLGYSKQKQFLTCNYISIPPIPPGFYLGLRPLSFPFAFNLLRTSLR